MYANVIAYVHISWMKLGSEPACLPACLSVKKRGTLIPVPVHAKTS